MSPRAGTVPGTQFASHSDRSGDLLGSVTVDTADISNTDEPEPRPRTDASEPRPRLRILYHLHLARIGGWSLPCPALETGRSISVGRRSPLFRLPGEEQYARPLDDPTVSRRQFTLSWSREDGQFRVVPAPDARRGVAVIDVRPADDGCGRVVRGVRSLDRETLLPAGSVIALGERVLLGLELARPRAAGTPRLGMVGECPALWQLRDAIEDVVAFGRPVLVSGPTGAGKELVALALHTSSDRAAGPFVTVNCGGLSEHLVESTLFGHKRGAFTGAGQASPGVFVAADRGTLFLDEIGEMPLAVQPKLLRATQERRVTPLGGHVSKPIDVRLVSATNRDLRQEVARGTFREDLYHRIGTHVLRVPPLSERRFDVPMLFAHFLGQLSLEHAELGWLWEGVSRWRPALPWWFVVDLLRRPWSGNVRELQNVAEQTARANLRADGQFRPPAGASDVATDPRAQGAVDLDRPPVAPGSLSRIGAAVGTATDTVCKVLSRPAVGELLSRAESLGWSDEALAREALGRLERRLLELLSRHGFNQTRVARELGVSRTTLLGLMARVGIRRAHDLGTAEIEAAVRAAAGDLSAAAAALKVSAHALKKRLAGPDVDG